MKIILRLCLTTVSVYVHRLQRMHSLVADNAPCEPLVVQRPIDAQALEQKLVRIELGIRGGLRRKDLNNYKDRAALGKYA